ncbi:MAG: thioredoxin domain-containing protein [Pseudomonadales bacterium]
MSDDEINHPYTNRLIEEDSPYLLQHAHNPVDWYPWGFEAFDKARAEDKPVFLSIGYSTCHWCHVMEHESFQNPEVAGYLNQHFVSIKLDREQRPDLDDIYMTGVQIMSGQGGWPMSNFLTHDGHPFHAGTYYPAADFMQLLVQLSSVWRDKREDVTARAAEVSNAIHQYTSAKSNAAEVSKDITCNAAAALVARLDLTYGGFGGAPKFPNESQLLVLIDDIRRNANEASRHTLKLTLDKMYQGGIYDQVAGGFHRYSVDAQWLVPHFEKMLYNQAQLLSVYSQAWSLIGDPAYRRIAIEIGDYVLRDMKADNGGFFSASDADSEGEEGLFFVWTLNELNDVLNKDDFDLVQKVYGASSDGNFEGQNILKLDQSLEELSAELNMGKVDLLSSLDRVKNILYRVREARIHPLRDEKVITAWNGMMISAFAIAGHELQLERFTEVAINAADVIWNEHLIDGQDEPALWRVSLARHVSIPAILEDYACFAEALLRIYYYVSSGDVDITNRHLIRGRALIVAMNRRFLDGEGGGYFISGDEATGPMITRPKSPMDGATPSANSVALRALVTAYQLTGELEYKQYASKAIDSFSGLIEASPSAFSYMVTSISDLMDGSRESVQFAAQGNVKVRLITAGTACRLKISIAEGWHINSNQISNAGFNEGSTEDSTEGYIVTEICNADGLSKICYPEGVDSKLSFSTSMVNLYTGHVEISFESESSCQVKLRLQACDDHICLAPELLTFSLQV